MSSKMHRAILSALFTLLLALGAVAPAAAQPELTGPTLPICVTRAYAGMTPRSLLAGRHRFDCNTQQTELGGGDFWALSAPVRRSGPVNVRVASLWQDRITVYALYADGILLGSTLDQQGTTRHIQLGAIIEQRFAARPAPLVRLLWHVEGAANVRGVLREARIATPDQSAAANLLLATLYAGFGGLCLALLCYNFALWCALRHPFQLAYCAMVLGLLLYTISSSGALAWAWPWIGNTQRIRINYLMLGLASVAAFSFARTFFEERCFGGRLGTLITTANAMMIAATIAYALFAPYAPLPFDRIYTWALVLQLAVVLPMVWRVWTMRSNYLWLFAFAWGAPIALACLRVASSLSLIRWSFWLDNSTIVSMTVEALLSSLAIAYRMRLLSLERDAARDGESAARLLADIDPLTGLLNRRAFLDRAIGLEGDQMLMIADLDHFKQVNDTIGHDGGDEVLRVFARTLGLAVPAEALVARIGGEEFAIVMPVHGAIEPRDLLARLRAARMPYDVAVTASLGTCIGPLLRESDWKALYGCADRALFDAKSAGRDRARDRTLPDRMAA